MRGEEEVILKVNASRISSEAERLEFVTVEASLARTPRLQQLLRYMAARYFAEELDQLTEYNIATEVFGRKKTEFIASEDAIARVETHRLRKKLAAYYDVEGKDHTVQITVPLGTYVPAFVESREGSGGAELKDLPERLDTPRTVEPKFSPLVVEPLLTNADSTGGIDALLQVPKRGFGGRWIPLVVALIVALLLGGLWLGHERKYAVAQDVAAPVLVPARSTISGSGSPVQLPFRVIAGYESATPQHDTSGQLWSADAYFHGGWAHRQPPTFIAGTSNPVLFQFGRDGDFTYDIPLAPGSYELHLYFMQGSDTAQAEDAENKAIFNVSINDVLTLKNFDIVSDAMGRSVGDERVFRGISPGRDGLLHLAFSTVLGTPSVSAIEIVAGSAARQNPIRLVMSPTLYTSRDGSSGIRITTSCMGDILRTIYRRPALSRIRCHSSATGISPTLCQSIRETVTRSSCILPNSTLAHHNRTCMKHGCFVSFVTVKRCSTTLTLRGKQATTTWC